VKNFGSILLAYMIGWGVFFVYFVTVARRTAALRKEIFRLKESLAKTESSTVAEKSLRSAKVRQT
jgi:hypothetical protein